MQNNFNISIFTAETADTMIQIILKYIIIPVLLVFSIAKMCNGDNHSKAKDGTKVSVVVIDPGHGGKDFGASAGSALEKDIVLSLALKLGQYIKSAYPDIKIIYTRDKDVFIPLYERAQIANRNKADLFISIHVNAVPQTYVHGTETYVLGQHRTKENLEVAKKENSVILLEDNYTTTYEGFDPNSSESYIMFELIQNEYLEQSVMFASDIQNQFREQANRADRSVKQSGFLVLRRISMPGVLVEAGFITNAKERSYMFSEDGKIKLASSIFEAFRNYKIRVENKSSFTLITNSEDEVNTNDASENNKKNRETETPQAQQKSNLIFSVQISATNKKLAPTPSNFKGEKNVFREDENKISRYFTGKFMTYDEALKEKNRIEKKFHDAFIVAFENGKLISVKNIPKTGN